MTGLSLQGVTGLVGATGVQGAVVGVTGSGVVPAGTIAVSMGGVTYYLLYSAGA